MGIFVHGGGAVVIYYRYRDFHPIEFFDLRTQLKWSQVFPLIESVIRTGLSFFAVFATNAANVTNTVAI